jgi:hypothetical protein
MGGNIAPLPTTQTRWYISDLESASKAADGGDLSTAARMYRAFRRDGVLSGLLSTCTDGMVRLPKRFSGDKDQVQALSPRNGTRSVFDEMCPPAELALLAADGRVLGVGVAELVPVEGRNYPVLRRLEPEFLKYRWNEGRWYYQSVAGLLPITPGDGRWVLHCPGGHSSPWQFGLWHALGRAWIFKEHALLHRFNYSSKLANPARAAVAPAGATEAQRVGFLTGLIQWGINTVFELPAGWDVKIVESNGRGFEVFKEEIESSDNEIMIALAGQVVTTTGGTGFANADIHKSIRADIIQSIADALAYTVNTQILPAWSIANYGIDSLETRAIVEWDVAPPKERNSEATSLNQAAIAAKAWREELAFYGRTPDIDQITTKFGVPIQGDLNGDGAPDEVSNVGLAAEVDDTFPSRNAAFYEAIKAAKDAGVVVGQQLVNELAQKYNVPAPEIPESASSTAEIFAYHIDAGVVTLDEVRSKLGLPPMPNGMGTKTAAGTETEAAPAEQAVDPDGDGLPGEPPEPDDVQALADAMTAAGVERCEHGAVNRCRLCGIERKRSFRVNELGETVWEVIWKPIVETQDVTKEAA